MPRRLLKRRGETSRRTYEDRDQVVPARRGGFAHRRLRRVEQSLVDKGCEPLAAGGVSKHIEVDGVGVNRRQRRHIDRLVVVDLKGNCRQYANLGAQYRNTVAPGGTFNLAGAVKADQAMADASPSPIHADAEYVVHQFANLINTLTKSGYKPGTPPTASQTAALATATQQFRQPKFVAAVQHIKTWVNQGCPS